LIAAALLAVTVAKAQTTSPVTDDALIQVRTPIGGLTSRYISTDKTGALAASMARANCLVSSSSEPIQKPPPAIVFAISMISLSLSASFSGW